MFHNNIVKISENLTSGTGWKSGSKLPTLQISAWFCFIFTVGEKVKIFDFLQTNDCNEIFHT